MIRLSALLLALITSTQAMAGNVCDDLWFSRNLAFDQAGYCFGSSLGQAIFDNSDCYTQTPALARDAEVFVDWVERYETSEGCHVDTNRNWLDIDLIETRRQLTTYGADLGFESTCVGWKGKRFPLYAADSHSAPILGWVNPGDDINWELEFFSAGNNWGALTIRQNGVAIALGWSDQEITADRCTLLAG